MPFIATHRVVSGSPDVSSANASSARLASASVVSVIVSLRSPSLRSRARLERVDQLGSNARQDRGADGEFPAAGDRIERRLDNGEKLERLCPVESDREVA
ncbi:MAG: hypothetical protein H0U21_08435 [Acidimicrobiia bacterium]|nr:hypothetical protein [Acidimicrobiia bacterium]